MRLSGQFIYLCFFYKDILHKSNTQALFKYLNTPKKHNKAQNQFHITPRSIIKHTSNFHLDITPRSIKKNK